MANAIYEISFPGFSTRRFMGSTTDMFSEASNHRKSLDNGLHFNWELQAAYAKYGSTAMQVVPVEMVADPDHLAERELFWANSYPTNEAYSINSFEDRGEKWMKKNNEFFGNARRVNPAPVAD